MKVIVTEKGKTEIIPLEGISREKRQQADEALKILRNIGKRNVNFNHNEREKEGEFIL